MWWERVDETEVKDGEGEHDIGVTRGNVNEVVRSGTPETSTKKTVLVVKRSTVIPEEGIEEVQRRVDSELVTLYGIDGTNFIFDRETEDERDEGKGQKRRIVNDKLYNK